jgi:small ligand-binding sensory domain FIST
MKQFLLARCAGRSGNELLDNCLKQLGSIPPEATFGFLYISDYLVEEAEHILSQLKKLTDIPHWVGTVGMGIIATNAEYYDQPAMAIMLADFNEADFYMLPNFIKDASIADTELTSWCSSNDFNVGLVHADPDNPAAQILLEQLDHSVPAAFLVGGITSSRGRNIQFSSQAIHGGLSGVLFSQAIPIMSNLTQGCTPISKRHHITHCEKNIIHSLDHKQALDVLNEDAGEMVAQDWENASGYIFAGMVNKNSDMDDYSVRQILGIDAEEKLIAVNEYLKNDDEIIFCRRDGNSAVEDLERMLKELKSRLNSPIKGGVYVSCLGRGREQFGDHSEEIKFIHSMLGEFPLVGFFANGEIHKSRLYGFTGVLTLFV